MHAPPQTPRAQRTSADVQTWEFSHPKFLRNRPDLLEEIKRKALDPDPATKQRVELPGEVRCPSVPSVVDRLANLASACGWRWRPSLRRFGSPPSTYR